MIDVLSLCVGAFAACWAFIFVATFMHVIELVSWHEFKRFPCDKTCMCGSPIDSHGWGDNHCAVSQLDWYLSNNPKPKFK